MGMSGGQLLRRVEMPLASPLIMAGIRTSAVAVVATATLAALVGWGGLGRYIIDGSRVHDYERLFAGALLVALLAIAVELVARGRPALRRPEGPARRGAPATATGRSRRRSTRASRPGRGGRARSAVTA